MSKVFVQPKADLSSFYEFLKYAVEKNYNVEITAFAYPHVLDGKWQELLKKYKLNLKNFKGVISTHGAFFDLIVASLDRKIAEVAAERIYHNLKIAKKLGARYAVFHANYNASIRGSWYRAKWVKVNAAFWKKVLKKYKITILLENFAEPAPDILRQLLDEVRSPRLKICLDTGHLNVYSEVSTGKWFSVLGKDICYMHINDNNGKADTEDIPGEGNISWRKMSENMIKIKPMVVFEVGTMEKTKKAIEYFKKHKLYPFNAEE